MAFPIMFSITCTSLSCYTLFALSCLTDWIFDSSRWPFKFSDISVVFVINAWILTGYARTFTRINQSNFYELLHFVIRISLQKLCRHYQPCHRVKLLKILYYQKYQQRNYQVSGTVSKISGYMTVLFRACLQFPLSAHTIRPLADTDTVHCKVFYLLTYLLTYLHVCLIETFVFWHKVCTCHCKMYIDHCDCNAVFVEEKDRHKEAMIAS